MKAMEIMQQKVKNVHNLKLIALFSVFTIFLFGGWQSKNIKALNEEQYELLNDAFKLESVLFDKTTISKGWALNINRDWLSEEVVGCLSPNEENRENVIKELTDTDFIFTLRRYILNQTDPYIIEQKRLKPGTIKLIKNDRKGTVTKISAPFIFEDKALVYFQSPTSETIYYFKKAEDDKWEMVCNFIIFAVFT
jgi:hypothetical protein